MRSVIPTMRRSWRGLVACLAVAGLLGAAGCAMAAEEISEQAAEQAVEAGASGEVDVDVDVDGDSGTMKIEGSDGSLNVGNDELPESFPDDLPLPEDFTVQMSLESPDNITVNVTTTDDFESLRDRLTSEFAEAGYVVDNKVNSEMGGVRGRMLAGVKGERKVSIHITEAESQTTVGYLIKRTST